MTYRLPDLEVGRTYSESEVLPYIALQGKQRPDHVTNDYSVAISGFPHADATAGSFDHKMWDRTRRVVMEYHEWSIDRFAANIAYMRSCFTAPDHLERIEAVKAKLTSGERLFPLWIEKHQAHFEPLALREGLHRLIAFADLGIQVVPIFLTKYAD